MCGIVGYWATTQPAAAAACSAALGAATETLRHRGPDASGLWRTESAAVGLGHRRLSILDLSDAGRQPMVAADAEIAICYNGEIYNFRELADELAGKGHRFAGGSDTEVILAAYREWGPDCVQRFIGMFAFAIWDGPRQQLHLMRDRAGVKPLYWHWDGALFAFSSELKALRALPLGPLSVSSAAIGEFLQYGCIAQPRSIYDSIRKLPAGCRLVLDPSKAPRTIRYWSLNDASHPPLQGDPAELEAELEGLLMSAIGYRLISDVPVGLFLSGGVDSSIVAALVRALGVDLETFTIGFHSDAHDESSAARGVAEHLGFRNNLLYLEEGRMREILEGWGDLYDEPFGDHSGVPTLLVSQFARERVTVALSADGGDELFCGYSGHSTIAKRMVRRAAMSRAVRYIAGVSAGAAAQLAWTLPVPQKGLVLDRLHKAAGFFGDAEGVDAVRGFRSHWQPAEIRWLLGESGYRDPRYGGVRAEGHPTEQLAVLDFHEYLQDDVLTKLDRATMAASLEGREPLLDHRIIEFAFRLPLDLRQGPLGNKHILRNLLYKHVPRALVDRPKQGFSAPVSRWVGDLVVNGALQDSIGILVDKLGMDRARLDRSVALYADSDQGRNRLWLLYTLGLWARRWG